MLYIMDTNFEARLASPIIRSVSYIYRTAGLPTMNVTSLNWRYVYSSFFFSEVSDALFPQVEDHGACIWGLRTKLLLRFPHHPAKSNKCFAAPQDEETMQLLLVVIVSICSSTAYGCES